MKLFEIISLVLSTIAFAFSCWLVFWTNAAVKFARRHNYAESKFLQRHPFSSIASKSWYPVYLRCQGIWMWLVIVVLLYLVFRK